MAAPAELTRIRMVDIGLGNDLQEKQFCETVDSSPQATPPDVRLVTLLCVSDAVVTVQTGLTA